MAIIKADTSALMATLTLATIVDRAARMHEESWDDSNLYYELSLQEAAKQAAKEQSAPHLAVPAHIMLLNAHSMSVSWASAILADPNFVGE